MKMTEKFKVGAQALAIAAVCLAIITWTVASWF